MYKYVGTYRVVCEFCQDKLKPCKEDTYIFCRGNGQIYRYNNEILCYYREAPKGFKKMLTALKERGIEVLDKDITSMEYEIYFYEKDLDKVIDIFKPMTKGKDIKPTSKRNLNLFDWYKNWDLIKECEPKF